MFYINKKALKNHNVVNLTEKVTGMNFYFKEFIPVVSIYGLINLKL